MTIDRTPAHLADMLGFVRELRAITAAHTLDVFLRERILNLAVVEHELTACLEMRGRD